tara:strand:+ start:1308 stop:1517 length:210 start_codon:yes stop_codon:yes gene_type:complete
MTSLKNKELYNYVFHYNYHENLWYAIPRDQYREYWNSKNSKNFLRSGDMNTLMYKVRLLEKDKRDVQKK